MTDINLAAIRARDTVTMETLPELERLAMTMEDEEMRAAILLVTDRHALLAAAKKVTCKRCAPANPGVLHEFYTGKPYPCPDCADLRRLLEEKP